MEINDDEEERWELRGKLATIGLVSQSVTVTNTAVSFALLKALTAPISMVEQRRVHAGAWITL